MEELKKDLDLLTEIMTLEEEIKGEEEHE